jgi:hypothetical protein
MHGHVLFLASHALRISGRLEPRLTLVAGSLVAPAFVALMFASLLIDASVKDLG